MWLRIPVELLAFNDGGGSGAGNGGGSGSGGNGDGTGNGGSDGQSGQGSGTGDGKAGSGDGGDDPDKPAGRSFTQEDVNRIVAEDRRKTQEAADRKAAKDRDDLAAKSLKDNQKFEELATARETQLTAANATIETLTAERDALKVRVSESDAAITKILAQQTKDLPPYLKPLMDKMTPAEQLTYLADNAEAIKTGATQAVPNHGSGTGAGAGSGNGSGSGTGQGVGAGALQGYLGRTYGQRQDGKK